MRILMLALATFIIHFCFTLDADEKEQWNMREQFLDDLVNAVPDILKSQDRESGRFGTQPWTCQDQNVIFPLAAAWAVEDGANPYFHSADLLEAIMSGGDALTDAQDAEGMWTFRKKDNSTWGQIFMPWTYSRWIRAYLLIRDAMPENRKAKWEKGLLLGFEGISKSCLGSVHNIPTHHAMSLYCAGMVFNRPDWKRQAAEFMARVISAQSSSGWWSEHSGPVVSYNFVYTDAIGVYFSLSGDESVLPALARAAAFHSNFTYPNGSCVETIDERNPYHASIQIGNVGFTMTPEGRGYLSRQCRLLMAVQPRFSADYCASMLLYGRTGETIPPASSREDASFVLGNNEAKVIRRGPWFVCLSAYIAEPSPSRWIQDRQSFLSVYHDKIGLIIGGGNTKLQPFFSNFTVGDPSLLRHTPGDANPDFAPKGDLIYTPDNARIADGDALLLRYGAHDCKIGISIPDAENLLITCEVAGAMDKPVEAHLPLMKLDGIVKSAGKAELKLDDKEISMDVGGADASFEFGGVGISAPVGSRLVWPKLPHNPYKRDGSADISSARAVLCLPFSTGRTKNEVRLRISAQ
ncbi:MAG TPA: hypothetical protein PL033_18950 [Candidatus Brocadiia bacterium]|nr:hypothetical protein [Candidatus Brocadiia bacterium]